MPVPVFVPVPVCVTRCYNAVSKLSFWLELSKKSFTIPFQLMEAGDTGENGAVFFPLTLCLNRGFATVLESFMVGGTVKDHQE